MHHLELLFLRKVPRDLFNDYGNRYTRTLIVGVNGCQKIQLVVLSKENDTNSVQFHTH